MSEQAPELDPALLAALQAGMAATSFGMTGPTLEDILSQTAYDISSRKGLGGSPVTWMPSWYVNNPAIQQLTPAQRGLVDPFLGMNGQGDERVYLGTSGTGRETRVIKNVDEVGNEVTATNVATDEPGDKTKTFSQVVNMPYMWDQDEINETIEKMNDAGLQVGSFDDMMQVWQGMVSRASMMYSLSAGENKVTPWDVLDMYKSEAKASGTLLDPNRKELRTSRSVNELTEGQSWDVLRSTLQQNLGRDPSDQEVRDFVYRMNSLAAKNPSITKTITQYKNGQAVSSNSTTSGGFTAADAAMAAYEDSQNDPDYAEYQSATTYFNSVLAALGPIGE